MAVGWGRRSFSEKDASGDCAQISAQAIERPHLCTQPCMPERAAMLYAKGWPFRQLQVFPCPSGGPPHV